MGHRKLRIVILGMMGRCPFAGQTWDYLNWISGFQRLGHDVWYVEDDTVWPYHPELNTITDDCSYAVKHIADCMNRFRLENHWAFRLADRKGACWGISESDLNCLYRECDVLINLPGSTDLRDEQLAAPFRVYLQTDPVTSELQLAAGDKHTKEAFANHHVIATYGENYGEPDCSVPLNGLTYVKTHQPIDLDFWAMSYNPDAPFFTTIGNYRQEGNNFKYNGEVYYWSKHYEWKKFIDLPRRTEQQFQLALNLGGPDDEKELCSHGWNIISPLQMSLDVFGRYPEYIRQSRAEFTVAKDQNIRLRSGWFSDRDACYLAIGKPVIAQDTGFGNFFPTGEGLYAFTTMEQALTAIEKININYCRECDKARAIAEEYFDAPKVAKKFLDDIGLG